LYIVIIIFDEILIYRRKTYNIIYYVKYQTVYEPRTSRVPTWLRGRQVGGGVGAGGEGVR